MDDADGSTTRKDPAVDIPQTSDPGARRTHRAGSARPKALTPTEGELHATIAELLDWIILPPAVWTTFPAGWGKLGKATAGRLHKSGLKPGFPDILIFYNGDCTGIELKAPGKTTSASQDAMFPRLRAAGMPIYICDCVADVIAALNEQRIPFRYVHGEQGGSNASHHCISRNPRRGYGRRRRSG